MRNQAHRKKNWKARLVSGLLSLTMVASLLPAGLFTLPAQAAEIYTGTLDPMSKDNPTAKVTFTVPGAGNASLGNYCLVLVPDLSSDSGDAVPSKNAAAMLNGLTTAAQLENQFDQYFAPNDPALRIVEKGVGKNWSNGSVTFTFNISSTFAAAIGKLKGTYFKGDGTKISDSDTTIPMVAMLYCNGVRGIATADWSTVANAELVPTTTPLKAVLVEGSCTIDDVIKNVGKGDSAISHIDVSMDGDEIGVWFDTYDYTLNDIAAGGSDTGTLTLALNPDMADNFAACNLTITITYNGGSKSPLQIPVIVVKDAGVTAPEELIFPGKVTYDEAGNFTGLTFTDASKNVTLTPGESGQYVLGDAINGEAVFVIDNDLGWDASSIQNFFDVGNAENEYGYFNVAEVKDFAIVPPGGGSELADRLTSSQIATTTDFVSILKIRVGAGDMDEGVTNSTELMVRLIARITPDFAEPAAQYNYTFKANKPSGSAGTVSGLPSGGQTTGSVSYPTVPTLPGYTFKGWGTSAAGAAAPTTADWTSGSKTISADTDFHAIWEPYTITFNPQGGKFSDGSSGNKAFNTVDGKLSAANVTAVNAPTREGYIFDGWYTAASGGAKLTDLSATKVFSGSATYYAHWKAVTVTFNANGGSLAAASGTGVFNTTNGKLTAADIGKVTGANDPTHANAKKAFRGWSTTTDAGDIVTLIANTVYNTNTTYYAIWGDLYTITYAKGGNDVTGTVPSSQTQTSYGEQLTISGAGNLARPGYVFGGWTHSTSTYQKDDQLAPTADITLTANWLKTYAVIYDGNAPTGATVNNTPSGDDNSGVGYLPGATTTVTTSKPTCAGYTFLGWATSADATSATYTGGETLTFSAANITLYAVWSELPAISGATATDASKFEFGGTVTLKNITLTAGDPLAASDVGATKKVPVAKWYVGNGGNSTTGPSRKTELTAGPSASCTIPAASAGTVFENDDIWVYLGGNGTDVKTDGKWVKLGTIGAKSASLTITPVYVSVTGSASTSTSLTPKPSTVGGGSYKAGVDVNISTSYNGEDLTFIGWSTKNDGTLVNTVGSGASAKTLIKSPVANATNGSATVNMNTNADGDPVATTIYAVYKVKPTLSFTVAKASGADIDSVKVTRSRGNKDITLAGNGGFGTYTDKVQVGDTVIVTSAAGATSDPDGFDISGKADGDDPDYQLITSSKSSVVVKLLKTGVTITAKSKAKPPRLNLEPSAGAGTLDGSTFTHTTPATVAVGNLGGSNAVSVTASISTTGDAGSFKVTTPALAGTIAPEDDSTLTIVPKDGVSLAVGTYSIPVTVDYQDADGNDYSATTTVTYVVSAVTTYTGQVIVKLDGNAVAANAATVSLSALNTTAVATASGGKVVYDGATNNTKKLNKGVAYTVSVAYGGKTYTANEKLSDTSAQVGGVPTVTVELFTVKLIAPNLSANQNALTASTAGQYITLTIPKVSAITGDDAVTKNVTRENLGNATNGQVSKVVQKGTAVTASAGGVLKSGNTFDKWTSDANGTTLVNSTASYTFTVTGATTLYAVMKKSATAVVTYQGNYSNAPNVDAGRTYAIGVPASQIVSLGTSVTLSSTTPKLPGYQFVGWSTVATRTAAQWNKTTNAGYDFAPGDTIAALGSAVAGFDSTNSSLTLYAVWRDATLAASNVTGANGVYGSYYGATPNFQVKLNNAANKEKLNYALGSTKLPGGLGLNAATGEVYGTPYQVLSNRAANVTITLAEDYHAAASKLKAEVTYTMSVGKATPKVTGVAISGAAEDKAINAATYTVTVAGPRLVSDNGSSADTLNNPADDVWETYTDTIVITAGTKTAGIGASAITGANASGAAVTKFVVGGDTKINATFEAATSGSDFDACSGNKQATVWKDTAEDAAIKGSATYTPNKSYQMAVRLGNESQDSDYAASKSWDYKTSDDKHARVGYNTSTSSGVSGLVTLGSGSAADSVAAKQFSLKNTGTGDLTGVSFTFAKGADSPFAIATAASLTSNKLPAGSTGNPVTFTVKVNAAKAAAKGTYQDTLTISSAEGNSVVIYLSFTVDEATTYKAQITTKFQTVANAYASPVVAAAAAKIGAANTNTGAVITLTPVGGGDNVVINSSTAYDATNKCYEVDLVTGKDYRLVVTGTGADGATGYTIPSVIVTSNNHAAEVTMHEVALKQHIKTNTHTDATATTKTNTSGSVSGAGWYVNGQSANFSTYSGFTAAGVNYTFVEWYSGSAATDAACTADGVGGANTSFSTPITVAKSFNAHYKVQDAATVKLTYDKNTTDNVLVPPAETETQNASGHFTISTVVPSRPGYIFNGWATTAAATAAAYQPGDQGPATSADATVYALWTKISIGPETWDVDPGDGVYGVDYSYAVPQVQPNAGKVSYELSATTNGTETKADGKTIITTLPGGLYLDAATGLISGKPYEVVTNKGPYVLKAVHELGDDVVEPLYSQPFYITVDKYQLQLTNTSVTGAVAGQGADTATYTATVVDAPIYKGKQDGVDVWGVTSTGTPEAFTETVTRTAGVSDASKLGTLALDYTGTGSDTAPSFNASADTSVKLVYQPSDKDASKDGNNSKHEAIYKPAKATVKASSGGSTYTMTVEENGRATANKGAAITMWGYNGTAADVKGFTAKEGYVHAASAENDKWGTGATVSASGQNDKLNAQKFTLANTGNQTTGAVKYRFGSATADNTAGKYFSLVNGTLDWTAGLQASGAASNGDKGDFYVIPVTGLPYQAAPYTDTLVITNANGFSVTVTLSFTVTADDMSLKVITYLWNKDRQAALDAAGSDATKVAAATAAAKMNLTAGQVVLVNTADSSKTITLAAAAGVNGEYTFTKYADNSKIAQDDSFYIKVNGYTVSDKTTGMPKVLSKANASVGVYLYEVTSAKHPTDGAAAAPTLASSKPASEGGITSANGSIYVVYGETATVTAQAAAAGYTYKELQDTTTKTAPSGDKATSGTTYTTAAVTKPKAYTAVYTQGYTLTYKPNATGVKVGSIAAEDVSSGHEPTATVIAADPADLATTKNGATYTGWTRTGYTFDHWNTASDGTGTSFAIGAGVVLDDYDTAGEVILYAIWRSADELTLEGETITVAYKETITKDFGATGGQSGKEYTAKKGDTAVNSNTNAVPDVKFVDGGETGANAEKFSFTGVSNDTPTGTDTEKTTVITVTVTDDNDDSAQADYTIIQKKADTEITKGFQDGVIGGDTAPKAGDNFDFTKLNKPTGGLEVIAKKADGDPNPNVDFDEEPTHTTPDAGKEGGVWSVTQIDGVPVPDGATPKFQEGEHTYTLTYTPTDPGFKPSSQTITIELAKKIDKVVVSLTYPVAGQTPVESGAFLDDANVHATASSPAAKKTDAIVASVVWPDGLDGAGKFDRSKDITVFVKVTPNTDAGWKFDKDNFTAEFSNVTKDSAGTAADDNVTATVLTVTDTDAMLQYTWKAQDVTATNIRVQVTAPSNGGKVDNDTALPVGTPAGSFTPAVLKWVKKGINDVTSANYAGLDALTDSDTVAPGTYVVIVTATANKGYLFNKDADKGGLAALDGKNTYAQINNKDAKVLKIETTADDRDKVTLAVEFTVEASSVTGLNKVLNSKLDYYVRTETSADSGDKHHDANATGHNSGYGFTLNKSDFTITASNDQGKSVTLNQNDFILFVDGATGTAGTYDSGDTILDTKSAEGSYTGSFEFVHDVTGDPLASSLDGRDVYVVYAPNGVVQAGETMTLKVGALTVKPLEAKTIAKQNNWSVDAAKKFQVSAANTTVSFNDGQPMANSVATVSYAARTGALATSVTAPAAAGDNRPSYYYMLDADNDGAITNADTELKANTDVSNAGGKGVYICYTDVNGHLVYAKVGVIGANFTVDIDDVNGQDPEYGDKLTGKPENPDGTPATPSDPDKPFTYQWEKEDPDHPGTWVPIPGGTSPDYVPGKDDIGDDIRVSVTDPGTGTTVSSEEKHIEKRSINLEVAAVDKRYDGDFYNNDHAYTAADFTATPVEKIWDAATKSFVLAAKDNVNTVFGGLLLGDKVTIAPYDDPKNPDDWNERNDGSAAAPRYTGRPTYQKLNGSVYQNNAEVGSEIRWPRLLDKDTVISGSGSSAVKQQSHVVDATDGYTLGGMDAASYRLRPQDVQEHRGIITDGTVTHVDVSFKEWPTYNHDIPGSPMGVTDERETQSQSNDQSYIATWYKVLPGKSFDPSDASTYTTVSEAKFTDGAKYAVAVTVKPQAGYRYELDETRNPYTRFYFHFGEYASSTKVEVSDNDHTAKNGKGVWVHDNLYTMYCTLDEVSKPDIAYVNVSIPQPVFEVAPVTDVSVLQVIGTDNETISNAVSGGAAVWEYLADADAGTWASATAGSGLDANGRFMADAKYRVKFTLTASGYKYLYTKEGKGVSFVASGEGELANANIAGTHTWNGNSVINKEIIDSVVTTGTEQSGKTSYDVVITYTPVKSGRAALLDVVVDASAATQAGVVKTGPEVGVSKPYALDATASNKWSYWTGSAWAEASANSGLDKNGKFLAGTDYRVEGTVKLTDTSHYQITDSTKFYIAGYEVTTSAEVEHHNDSSEKTLTASKTAVNGVYPADTVFTLVKTFSIPKEKTSAELVLTYPEPEAGKEPLPSRNNALWTWEYLSANVAVDETVDSGKKTVGTTWYATTLKNDPSAKTDFAPDGMTQLSGNFAFDTYYMVQGVITPDAAHDFAEGELYVTVNGVRVKVDGDMDAKYDAAGKTKIGWAMAESVKNADGKVTAVKARYIAKTAPAATKIIYEVEGNISKPSPNASISKAVSGKRARFEKTNADATDYVTLSDVVWSKSSSFKADGSGYTPIADAETTFQAGMYYKAVFTATADTANGYSFQVKNVDTNADDFVAFLINSVTKDNGDWVNDKSTPDSATSEGIKVSAKQVDSSDKYELTVLFPLTGEPKDLAVIGNADEPKANQPESGANIWVDADKPYRIKQNGGKEEKKWQHYTASGWTDMAAGENFKAGDFYRAVMEIELKPGQENFYKFTGETTGRVDTSGVPSIAGTAAALPTAKPDMNSLKTNIIHNKTGETVTDVTLVKEFRVPKLKTLVEVDSPVPTAGAYVYQINPDVTIHATGVGKYTLSDGDGVQGRWYNATYALMGADDVFEAGKTYYLITTATAEADYIFSDEETGYKWYESGTGATKAASATKLFKDGGSTQWKTENGEVVLVRVAFEYFIPSKEPSIIPGWAEQPVTGNALSAIRTEYSKFDVVGEPWWTKDEQDSDDHLAVGTTAGENAVYYAHIKVKAKDGVIVKDEDTYYRFNYNGVSDANFVWHKAEKDANGEDIYYLVYKFEPTEEAPEPPAPSGGGGGSYTVESPIVYYHLKDQGVTSDPTAEKVKKNGKPKNVPTVKAVSGLVFKGWSEVDPSTLPTGKLPTLVDPTTFKITGDKTFYAVYERGVDHKHYVIGFPNGTFGPDAKITRAEVATIIARSCLDGFVEGANYGNPGNYSDVSHHWAFSAIAFCAKAGVFTGYEDATFRPDRYITRQELATVVARLAGVQTSKGVPFHDKDDIASWAQNGVYTAYASGWIKGYEDGTFLPEREISRAETVKIFNGYLKRGVNAKGLEGLKEYVHTGVASNNEEDGHDEYMTWPDVPKTHWAYHEVIEAANDHNYHWQDAEKKIPPEDWDEVYINEKWKYNDNLDDGADKRDENISAQKTFTVTYLVVKDGIIYDSVSETVERFSSPDPSRLPTAVPDEGYRFAGWSSTDPSTGVVTLVDPTASSVTADKWYYAVFEEDVYQLPVCTVTYVIGELGSYDGATQEQVEMFQAPSPANLPKPVVKEGYHLAGWSETDPVNGEYTLVDPTANYVTGDKTFYAIYKENEPYRMPVYTVKYVIGNKGSYKGATEEQVEMFQAPSPANLPKPKANKGYHFIGWSETDPAKGKYTLVDPTANYVTGDKTFYAVYKAD